MISTLSVLLIGLFITCLKIINTSKPKKFTVPFDSYETYETLNRKA